MLEVTTARPALQDNPIYLALQKQVDTAQDAITEAEDRMNKAEFLHSLVDIPLLSVKVSTMRSLEVHYNSSKPIDHKQQISNLMCGLNLATALPSTINTFKHEAYITSGKWLFHWYSPLVDLTLLSIKDHA